MRDRLIELLRDTFNYTKGVCIDFDEAVEINADHLLENGVIVPPCKVGDTVYVPWRWAFQQGVATVKVEEIKFYDSQMHYMFLIDMESDNECFNQSFGGWKTEQSIGRTVFLSKEEAEKALAKMKGGAE